MHAQVLVIMPEDVKLEDVMYPFQEIDKTQAEKMTDDRCDFFLAVAEDEVPELLEDIRTHLEEYINKCLEELQYRSEHTYEEFREKYGNCGLKHTFGAYKIYCDDMREYEKVKGLPVDHIDQIKFIKDNGFNVTDKWIDIYIKGKGYGTFHNPRELWDYYTIVNEHRFPKNVFFLVDTHGNKHNKLLLSELDIDKTVDNISELTRVWEHIIFCEKEPKDAMLLTVDDIRFDKPWNEYFRVNLFNKDITLKDTLYEIAEKCKGSRYQVTAIDTHW